MTETFVIQSDIALLPSVEERLFHFCQLCHVGNYYSAVSVAALTVYDMCKAVQRDILISDIRPLKKTGGVHGDYVREE